MKTTSSSSNTSISTTSGLAEEERIEIKQLVRHHVHDLRNYINCANMEATLLGETSVDAEVKETVRSLCEQLQEMDRLVTTFSKKFRHYPDPESDVM